MCGINIRYKLSPSWALEYINGSLHKYIIQKIIMRSWWIRKLYNRKNINKSKIRLYKLSNRTIVGASVGRYEGSVVCVGTVDGLVVGIKEGVVDGISSFATQ